MVNSIINQDTIAAIATPIGASGVSVIRLSGFEAWQLTYKIFKSTFKKPVKSFEHSKFYHGWIIDPDTNILIDEVIILAFKSPKSYTTEDVIEIQCHGGINVTRKILDLCLKHGARLAEKGEFTKRAFLGGRIDLTQVEAVLDIISAKTNLFSSAAAYNLSGKLSILINNLRTSLIDLLASIHASIDFPDEVDELPYNTLSDRIHQIIIEINTVLTRATNGTILKQGIKAAIVGKPNVGKSSLFNYLLNSDRAIVTNIPGTTRDILQEYIDIDGIPLILTDTAGIRETSTKNDLDYVESIGINRSINTIQDSDLILFIYDARNNLEEADRSILEEAQKYNKPLLIIANKADLLKENELNNINDLKISATTGMGINSLKENIKDMVLGSNFKVKQDEVYINMRHKEALENALKYLHLSHKAAQRKELQDLISIDIKSALLSLDEIVGEAISETIIDHIFSQFCIGK